jgi:hypothetical protein
VSKLSFDLHTHHSHFNPERVEETLQEFHQDVHSLLGIYLALPADVTSGKPIEFVSGVSTTRHLVAFNNILGRKGYSSLLLHRPHVYPHPPHGKLSILFIVNPTKPKDNSLQPVNSTGHDIWRRDVNTHGTISQAVG